MKILFYEASSGFGGSANALVNIISHLDKKKFTPIVIFRNFGPQFEKLGGVKLIKIRNYSEKKRLNLFGYIVYFTLFILPESCFLYFITRKHRVSLVHINTNIIDGIAPILAAKLARIPCICHVRRTGKLLKREIFFSRFIHKFIVLNTKSFEIYNQYINVNKIELIPDGIDLNNFSPNIDAGFRNEFNLNSDFLIGLVGRIVDGKGHEEFILSAREILKKYSGIKFIIIGDAIGEDDEYRNKLIKLVSDLRLSSSVIFTGWRSDINRIIPEVDLLVLPSTTFPEGLPNVVLEAMAAKKPVIASNLSALSDVVINNVTGFLIPAGDIKSLIKHITILLMNRELSFQMGEAGYKRIKKKFDILLLINRITDIYEAILDKPKNAFKRKFRNIIIHSPVCSSMELFTKKIKKNATILMYHKIVRKKDLYFDGLELQLFESQIRYLKNNFTILSLSELTHCLINGKNCPKNSISITFDDGYKCIYENVLPLFTQYKIPASIFLTVDNIEQQTLQWFDQVAYILKNCKKNFVFVHLGNNKIRLNLNSLQERKKSIFYLKQLLKYTNFLERQFLLSELRQECEIDSIEDNYNAMLNWKEITELSKNEFEIGAHTMTHPILSTLNNENATQEIVKSKIIIENKINKQVDFFCYPNGLKCDFNNKIKEIVKNSGFRAACSSIEGVNNNTSDFFELKRLYTTFPTLNHFRFYLSNKILSNE